MKRKIIFYENYFMDFYLSQESKVQEKIQYVLELIRQVDRVPEKFLKYMEGTNGLFEIRIAFKSNIYLIFCCFDDGQLVVLFNGFQKKSQKTPKQELMKAEKIMKEYFESKSEEK